MHYITTMNYRHIYHAGNFADVIKHLLLVGAVDYLLQKDKGMMVLDAFSGCGIYQTDDERAAKTGEFDKGAALLKTLGQSQDPLLSRYMALLKQAGFPAQYPGSPWLIAKMLRDQDRGVFNELHPEDYRVLRRNILGMSDNVTVHKRDAYEVIRGHIPPAERRGLVLIDPPFEKKDEFELLQHEIPVWFNKWPTGSYVIWYPIKSHLPVNALKETAKQSGFKNVWVAELLIHPRFQRETFNGCGLLCLNTPFPIPDMMSKAMPAIIKALGTGSYETEYLVKS